MRAYHKAFAFSVIAFYLLAIFAFSPFAFAETNVSDKVELIKSSLTYDRRAATSSMDVAVSNISQEILLTPIKVVIESISDSSITVANADGVTDDGRPYFQYTTDLGGVLQSESTDTKKWTFSNPNRARFSFDTIVFGQAGGDQIPYPPTGLSASYDSVNQWNWITWNPVPGASTYRLYWGTESGVTKTSEYAGETFNTEFSHTGVVPGWTYYYRVSAVNAWGESELSEERSVYVPFSEFTFTNSLGMTFNLIPAGTFMMGSPADEPERYSNETLHQVTLTKSYYMQTTEVTQGQWREVMGSNPSYFTSCGDDCPVERVSWNDVQAFITELNKRGEGTYRLPTEAEWEYAARAGTTTPFYTGNCLSTNEANYDGGFPLTGCPSGVYRGKTVPVASFAPNAWGLYDMHGNVWEWVQDWYGSYPSGAVTDPTGPSSGSFRVFRGGSWVSTAGYCRSANRFLSNPDYRFDDGGFRLVLPQVP